MRIPVQVEQRLGIDRQGELLLGGVPLGRGSLKQGGWMTLGSAAGGHFPVYGQPAAWWPDGSIKWLHLCGRMDLGPQALHELELDTQAATAGGALPALAVAQSDDVVAVSGGPLLVRVGSNLAGWVQAQMLGGPALELRGLEPVLEVIGPEDDATLRRCIFRRDAQVTVVVNTPNRVVVRSSGEFIDPTGRPMAQLRLFVEVLADLAELRLEPVLIYLGDPERDLIRKYELRVQTNLGAGLPTLEETAPLTRGPITDAAAAAQEMVDPRPIDLHHFGFGEGQGRGCWDQVRPYVSLARFPIARQVQLGSTFYRIDKRVAAQHSWVKASEGQQAQGWCHLNNNAAGITAAIRYFWQEYPTALEVDAAAGTITFGLWPASAAALDLRRYSAIRYGADSYEHGNGPFPAQTHGATGIAKARELVLQFHGQPAASPERQLAVARRALAFLAPLRPMAGGDYFAQTDVVGRVASGQSQVEPQAQQRIATIIGFLAQEQKSRGWYGLMDFGDVIMSYYSNLQRWSYDDGGYGWTNSEHLPDYGLWINALRSARGDWLNLAIEMSRHNRDVDTYHWGNFIGSGSRHNVNHWGCSDKEWRVSMPISRRLHYYCTADPWTAEVIRTSVATYQSYERTSKTAPSMTAALMGVMTKWEMSGAAADGVVVSKMADAYAQVFCPEGGYWSQIHFNLATGDGYPVKTNAADTAARQRDFFFMDGFGGQHALCELADLLGHQALSAALVGYGRYRMEQLILEQANSDKPSLYWKHGPLVIWAHAYRATGESRFLEALSSVSALAEDSADLEAVGGTGLLDEPQRLAPKNVKRRNKYTCWLASHLLTIPYALHALAQSKAPAR